MKEALKLALEALEEYVNVVVSVNDPNEWTPKVADAGEPARKAITAIKEALAQPEQEPVAWLTEERYAQLHTAQRTWVGLTDEEVGDLSDFAYANDEEFVRNVEKYLKEKNNG